jgi:hypothetical protein
VRPTIGNINLDFGVAYFAYPGEAMPGPTNGVDYWELSARADTQDRRSVPRRRWIRLRAGRLEDRRLGAVCGGRDRLRGAEPSPAARHQRINHGRRRIFLVRKSGCGARRLSLPAYLNWQAGVTMAHKKFNLDLRYHDTNLSKEGCFVFTGDPNARAGRSPGSCHQSRRPHLRLVRRSLRREALVRVELSQPRRDVFPGRRGDVSAELSQAERESGRGRRRA